MDAPINDQNTHLANMGRMIEDQESKMRLTINEIYFGKTKKVSKMQICYMKKVSFLKSTIFEKNIFQVMSDLRSTEKQSELEKQDEIVRELNNAMANRGN